MAAEVLPHGRSHKNAELLLFKKFQGEGNTSLPLLEEVLLFERKLNLFVKDLEWATVGRFPLGVTSRTCLANLSWDILDTWPNQHSRDFSIRRRGSSFRALRILELRTLSRSVTQ